MNSLFIKRQASKQVMVKRDFSVSMAGLGALMCVMSYNMQGITPKINKNIPKQYHKYVKIDYDQDSSRLADAGVTLMIVSFWL